MDPDTKVSMKVMRDGRAMDFTVTLGDFPSNEEHASLSRPSSDGQESALQGVTVENLDGGYRAAVKAHAADQGRCG